MDPLTYILNTITGAKLFKTCSTNVPIRAPLNLPPHINPSQCNKVNIVTNCEVKKVCMNKNKIQHYYKRDTGHEFDISMNDNEVYISLRGSNGCEFDICLSDKLITRVEIRNICYNYQYVKYFINLVNNVSVLILNNWDLSNVISLDKWFYYNNCKEIYIDELYTGDNESTISFEKCDELKLIEFTHCQCHKIKNINFKDCLKLKHVDLSCSTFFYMDNLESTFKNCVNLDSINFTGTLLKNVTNISHCFDKCHKLTNIDYSKLHFDRLFNISYAFSECESIEVADFTDWVICEFNGSNFLNKCTNLHEVRFNPKQIIPIINASYCFAYCSNIRFLDLTTWEIGTHNADLSHAFEQCGKLEELLIPLLDPFYKPNINRWLYGCYNLYSIVCTYDMFKYMCFSNGFPDHTTWKYNFNEMRAIKINEICIDRYKRMNHYVYRSEK